ncbi:MAG: ABC transporter permease [Anaerolineaceae bacterium]|nr:ABC transporter permease [Anaerolineaceae bacterium]
MAFYLAFKEVWRNRGRFFLFSLVIALITTLVLFIAALAEGLALANKEYLSKLDAELVVFQKNVDTSIAASRIGRSKLNDIRRVDGVKAIGSIGFSTGSLVFTGQPNFNVSLVGVEPGQPGNPPVVAGRNLGTSVGSEAVIDGAIASRKGTRVGDILRIKTIQGTEEKIYNLRVVGITTGQQYLFAPSIFIPYCTWDSIRPQGSDGNGLVEIVSNIVAVKLENPQQKNEIANLLLSEVSGIEVTDIPSAIKSLPGYSAQQSTLTTQQVFTLLIGVLVVGGFFQIQLLQKIPQIGVLKAIGTSNATVAGAVVMQIIIVTTSGVLLGGITTAGLVLGMPASVPIVFTGSSVILAVSLLLAIGPLGGLVSVFRAVSVEPLLALGLQS